MQSSKTSIGKPYNPFKEFRNLMREICFSVYCLLFNEIHEINLVRHIMFSIDLIDTMKLYSDYDLEKAYFSLGHDFSEGRIFNTTFPLGIEVYERLVNFYKLGYLPYFYRVLSPSCMHGNIRDCIIHTSRESLCSFIRHKVDLNELRPARFIVGVPRFSMLMYALDLEVDPVYICHMIDVGCRLRIDTGGLKNQFYELLCDVAGYLERNVHLIELSYLKKIFEDMKLAMGSMKITEGIEWRLYEAFQFVIDIDHENSSMVKKIKTE